MAQRTGGPAGRTRSQARPPANVAGQQSSGQSANASASTQSSDDILQSVVLTLQQQQQMLMAMADTQLRAAGTPAPPSAANARALRVGNELHDVASQQAFLRTALDSGWTELWNAGRLGITGTEGMEAVVNRLGNYLRSRRNPLLDRQRFHARSQRDGETLDQYYSALAQIDRACDFQDEHRCQHCNHRCGFGAQIRETRLRDRLICGLKDKELVRRILEKQFDNHQGLTLDQVCSFALHMNPPKRLESALNFTRTSLPMQRHLLRL